MTASSNVATLGGSSVVGAGADGAGGGAGGAGGVGTTCSAIRASLGTAAGLAFPPASVMARSSRREVAASSLAMLAATMSGLRQGSRG